MFSLQKVVFFSCRDLPLSILIGIPLVTGCYVLVNIAYLAVLTPAEIKISSAVAVVSSSKLKSQHLLLEGELCSIFLIAYCRNDNVARHVQCNGFSLSNIASSKREGPGHHGTVFRQKCVDGFLWLFWRPFSFLSLSLHIPGPFYECTDKRALFSISDIGRPFIRSDGLGHSHICCLVHVWSC